MIEYGNGIPAIFLFLKTHQRDRELIEQAITIFLNLMDSGTWEIFSDLTLILDRVRNSSLASTQELIDMLCQLTLSDSLLISNGSCYILYKLFSLKGFILRCSE